MLTKSDLKTLAASTKTEWRDGHLYWMNKSTIYANEIYALRQKIEKNLPNIHSLR